MDEATGVPGAGPDDGGEPAVAEGGGSEPPASEPSDVDPPSADPLEEAKAEASKYRDQLLRTAADFDNFRKRHRRELEEADRRGREETLKDLLPVFDNLERAVAHAESASDVASLAEGILMVMRQFTDTLSRMNIQRVEAAGKSFDPMVHEAIQQLETSEHPPGTITAEVQAGYLLGDHLIRPAMVVVAKAPPDGDTAGAPGTPADGSNGAGNSDVGEA